MITSRGKEQPVLSRVGEWVAGLEYSDVPSTTLLAAKYQTLNMVAAAHAAADSEICREIEDSTVALAGESGVSTVIASGKKLPPVEAALVNASYAMAQDFDDIIWTGHTCHSAVFAPLAVAEHEGLPSEQFLTAVVVANEVAGRLAASCYFGPLNGQMTTYVHLIGAAAGVAKLLDLSAEQTTHAMAIALAQPNFQLQPAFFRPTSKLLTASTPTAAGIRAAYFARGGVTGEPAILEDPKGFWSRFSFVSFPGQMNRLGEFWTTETLSFKPYPGCFYFQTTCSALKEIIEGRPAFGLDDVVSVEIATSKFGVEVTQFAKQYGGDREITPVNVDFDISIASAIMLHVRRFTVEEHHAEWLKENETEIRQWQQKISVRHDPEMTLAIFKASAAIPGGREALKSLRVRDIAKIVRRYRSEYKSTLVTPRELPELARAVVRNLRGDGLKTEMSKERHSTSALPLYFPGQATITFTDGTSDSVRVDLPTGAFCSPSAEAELHDKFIRETTVNVGNKEAAQAFNAGLTLEQQDLTDWIATATPPQKKPPRRLRKA